MGRQGRARAMTDAYGKPRHGRRERAGNSRSPVPSRNTEPRQAKGWHPTALAAANAERRAWIGEVLDGHTPARDSTPS